MLPFFLVYAFFTSLVICLLFPISCIYVSDGLLSPLGFILKILTRKPVIVNIHGRDIAFVQYLGLDDLRAGPDHVPVGISDDGVGIVAERGDGARNRAGEQGIIGVDHANEFALRQLESFVDRRILANPFRLRWKQSASLRRWAWAAHKASPAWRLS